MNNLDKIEKNARAIKAVIGLILFLCGLVYGFCVFIYKTKECSNKVTELTLRIEGMKTASNLKHQELENRIAMNEKNFQMITTKLDVSLDKISTDLQFIKEHLIRKGLSK